MEEKPWLDQYDTGVPHTLRPYPAGTLLDVVSETARQRPDHPALLFQGRSSPTASWSDRATPLPPRWSHGDVKKGDRVALLLPNCPQFVIAQLGVWKAGAVVAPINPLYTDERAGAHVRDVRGQDGDRALAVLRQAQATV